MAEQFKYQPEWQGPLSGRSFEKQTEDAINRALASGTANASDATPLQAGAATPGTSDEWSRGDHVHPPQTSITGNAATATRLQNTRSIRLSGDASGVASFNGTGDANIAVSIPQATTSVKGLMSSADKTKLDSVESGANNYTLPQATTTTLGGVRVDAALDGNSTNPVRNSAVKSGLDSLQSQIGQTVKLTGTQIIAGEKTFTSPIHGQLDGNAANATRLATGRYIGLSGAVTAQAKVFDGTSDISIIVSNLDATKLSGTAPVNVTGNAATATKLASPRSLKTDLASTATAYFDGSAPQDAIPVTGVLPVGNGGTGSATKNFVDLTTEQQITAQKIFGTLRITALGNFAKTTNDDRIILSGGSAYGSTNGAFMLVHGSNYSEDPGFIHFYTGLISNSSGHLVLNPNGSLVWNGQPVQTSSDERLKTVLCAVPDEVLDAWGDVMWGQFQFLDAVERKGKSARLHLGLIAQRVKKAFEDHGLDACAYGILCHEEREESDVEADGEHVHVDAVDLWTVRYAEAQSMEAAFQRRRADRLEARIAELEKRLAVPEESKA